LDPNGIWRQDKGQGLETGGQGQCQTFSGLYVAHYKPACLKLSSVNPNGNAPSSCPPEQSRQGHLRGLAESLAQGRTALETPQMGAIEVL